MNIFTAMCYQVDYWSATLKLFQFNIIWISFLEWSLEQVQLCCCPHTNTLYRYSEACFAAVLTFLDYLINPALLLSPHCYIILWILLCCCLYTATSYGEYCFAAVSTLLHHMVNPVLLLSHHYLIWWILLCWYLNTATLSSESFFPAVSTLPHCMMNPAVLLSPHCDNVWWILL